MYGRLAFVAAVVATIAALLFNNYAYKAKNIMDVTSKELVVVIGAGVNGLQAALFLAEAGYTVNVIGEHLPGDPWNARYPSAMSASNWATDTNAPEDPEVQDWYKDSYTHWMDMAENDEFNASSVRKVTYNSHWENPPSVLVEKGPSAYWYSSWVKDFRVLPARELPPDIPFGTAFSSVSIDAPKYLKWLQNGIENLGGEIIRGRLPTDHGFPSALEAARTLTGNKKVFAYINASGLGAGELVRDSGVFAMKSHWALVKGVTSWTGDRVRKDALDLAITTANDPNSNIPMPIWYCVARSGSGTTTLGGFMQQGVSTEGMDEDILTRIVENNKMLAKDCLNESRQFDIIAVGAGLRPHRKQGPRVEIEHVSSDDGDESFTVVHDYGHSHGGFIKSIGSARKVVRLVDSLHRK